jgi:hypothetical protein
MNTDLTADISYDHIRPSATASGALLNAIEAIEETDGSPKPAL